MQTQCLADARFALVRECFVQVPGRMHRWFPQVVPGAAPEITIARHRKGAPATASTLTTRLLSELEPAAGYRIRTRRMDGTPVIGAATALPRPSARTGSSSSPSSPARLALPPQHRDRPLGAVSDCSAFSADDACTWACYDPATPSYASAAP
jgi:hypothetical protein